MLTFNIGEIRTCRKTKFSQTSLSRVSCCFAVLQESRWSTQSLYHLQHTIFYCGGRILNVCCWVATLDHLHHMPRMEWWQNPYVLLSPSGDLGDVSAGKGSCCDFLQFYHHFTVHICMLHWRGVVRAKGKMRAEWERFRCRISLISMKVWLCVPITTLYKFMQNQGTHLPLNTPSQKYVALLLYFQRQLVTCHHKIFLHIFFSSLHMHVTLDYSYIYISST